MSQRWILFCRSLDSVLEESIVFCSLTEKLWSNRDKDEGYRKNNVIENYEAIKMKVIRNYELREINISVSGYHENNYGYKKLHYKNTGQQRCPQP